MVGTFSDNESVTIEKCYDGNPPENFLFVAPNYATILFDNLPLRQIEAAKGTSKNPIYIYPSGGERNVIDGVLNHYVKVTTNGPFGPTSNFQWQPVTNDIVTPGKYFYINPSNRKPITINWNELIVQ